MTGLSRSARAGPDADAIAADVLDRDAVIRAVEDSAPDAIVNMLTAIPARLNPKRMSQDFAVTNRLRTEGTESLLHAAKQFGISQIVGQGLAYAYDPDGADLAHEDTPLWQDPPESFGSILDALRQFEAATVDAQGTVLRLGYLHVPGTNYAANGSFIEDVSQGKVPLVGGGTSTFSFTHTLDAAAAAVAALSTDQRGLFNFVDDEPAKMNVWLPHLTQLLDAPEPKRVPKFVALFAVGSWGVAYMTQLRGANNARAKRLLNWQPKFSTWPTGFTSELAGTTGQR